MLHRKHRLYFSHIDSLVMFDVGKSLGRDVDGHSERWTDSCAPWARLQGGAQCRNYTSAFCDVVGQYVFKVRMLFPIEYSPIILYRR